MARQTVAKTVPAGPRPLSAATAVTVTAADATNKEQFVITERDILVIWNSHASTTYTYTITGTADTLGRTVDIGPTNLLAQAFVAIRPGYEGFAQATTNYLFFEASNAAVKYFVLSF
jgi:hypothetical protein